MSVAAVMLAKDEADVIEPVVRHLLANVDEVIVSENGSTDGTADILYSLVHEFPLRIVRDDEVGYFQSRKTTALAEEAAALGHAWVVPCDADEVWYSTDGRTLSEFLAGLAPDVVRVRAPIYNHFPTALDPPVRDLVGLEEIPGRDAIVDAFDLTPEPNPLKRIGWRQREHQPIKFGKVACRLRPGLVIEAGNHGAYSPGRGGEIVDLAIRHYSWRSVEQYVRKIRNGQRAYEATDLPESAGAHWRGWADKTDEQIADHFHEWFWWDDPASDDSLIFDPVTPILRGC